MQLGCKPNLSPINVGKVVRGIALCLTLLVAAIAVARATPAQIELQCAGRYTDYINEIRELEVSGVFIRVDPGFVLITGMSAFDGRYPITESDHAWVSFAESEYSDPGRLPMDRVRGRFGSINRIDGKLTVFSKRSGVERVSRFVALEGGALKRLF